MDSISNISAQPKSTEKVTQNLLNQPQAFVVNPNGVYKTPQTDTVQISANKSDKKQTLSDKTKAIIATVAASAVAITAGIVIKNKSIAKKAAKAAEKTAREAAEKTAKEAAEKTAKEAAEKAAREAQEKAAREAESKAAREAEAKAAREAEAKAARESEAKAAREAEEKTAKETEARLAKEAEEKLKNNLEQLEILKKDVKSLPEDELENLTKTNYEEISNLIKQVNGRGPSIFSLDKQMTREEKIKYDFLTSKNDILKNERITRRENLLQKYLSHDSDRTVKSVSGDTYLTREEQEAFSSYYDNYAYNSSLRKGIDPKSIKEVVLMDKSFEKAPALQSDATVFRAVSGSSIFKDNQAFIDSLKENTIIKDKSFVSTSLNATNAQFRQFAENALETDGVLMRIRLPKGTKGVNGGYLEYVLPRNSEIKINKIEVIDGHKIADCEYILPKQ